MKTEFYIIAALSVTALTLLIAYLVTRNILLGTKDLLKNSNRISEIKTRTIEKERAAIKTEKEKFENDLKNAKESENIWRKECDKRYDNHKIEENKQLEAIKHLEDFSRCKYLEIQILTDENNKLDGLLICKDVEIRILTKENNKLEAQLEELITDYLTNVK